MRYATEPTTEADGWECCYEDSSGKVWRKDIVLDDGIHSDAVKAFHTYEGVTAREVAEYYFDPVRRLEFEGARAVPCCRAYARALAAHRPTLPRAGATLEGSHTVEPVDENTVVLHTSTRTRGPSRSARRSSCCTGAT